MVGFNSTFPFKESSILFFHLSNLRWSKYASYRGGCSGIQLVWVVWFCLGSVWGWVTSLERQRRKSQAIQKEAEEDINSTASAVRGRVPALCVPVSIQPESRELLIQIRALTERPSGVSAARLAWTVLSPMFAKAWLTPWHEGSGSLEHRSYILKTLKSTFWCSHSPVFLPSPNWACNSGHSLYSSTIVSIPQASKNSL